MSDLPQISEAEFEVMKIVWKHAPISTNEITDKLLQTTNWSPKTIQTLIKRLNISARKATLFWNVTMMEISLPCCLHTSKMTDCLKQK